MSSLADFPFAPRRLPFFYGWIILGAATLGVLMSIPGQTLGVGVFTDSLLEATGRSRTEVSHAYLAGTLLSALCLPTAGRALDRYGARATGIAAVALLSLTLLYLSAVDRAAAAFGGSVVATMAALVLGFFLLRFSGQGVLTLVSRTLIARWFDRHRGLASGLSGLFIGFGFGLAPRLFDDWIHLSGWRGAWQQMALIELLLMGTVVLVLFRSDPESCGLRLDGQRLSDAPPPVGPQLDRAAAVRTLAFWAVTLALAVQAMIITGVSFHVVDLGASVGLSRGEAVALFLPMAVASTVVGLLAGTLGDRVGIRVLLVAMMAAQAVGIFGAADLSSRFWLAALGLGMAGGFYGPLPTLAFPRFFGRRHLGAIAGLELMAGVVGSALGPSSFALARDGFGSYGPALYACLALPAAVAALALTYRVPRTTA